MDSWTCGGTLIPTAVHVNNWLGRVQLLSGVVAVRGRPILPGSGCFLIIRQKTGERGNGDTQNC